MTKSKKKSNQNIWLFAATLSLIVILSLVLLGISYSNILVRPIDNLVAQIPYIPKTAKQVLVRSQHVTRSLNSYKVNFSFGYSSESASVLNLTGNGSIAGANTEESRSESSIKGDAVFPEKIDFDFQTYSSGNNLFFKVNEAASISGFDTTKLGNNWYQIDLEDFQKNLGVSLRSDQEIIDDVSETIDKYINDLLENGDLNTAKFENTSEESKEFYRLSLEVREDPLTKAIGGQSSLDKKTKITIKIDKKTFYLTELTLESAKGQTSNLAFKFNYKITHQNQTLEIKRPENATEVENPIDFYLLLNPEAKNSVEGVFGAIGSQVPEAAANLMTIERINRVMLLLPKSL